MKRRSPKKAVAKSRVAKPRLKAKPTAKAPLKSSKSKPAIRAPSTPNAKELARRWLEGLWNDRNRPLLAELMHEDGVGDTEAGVIRGHADFYSKLHDPLVAAFPDMRVQIDGVVGEGDDAVARWTVTATHSGDGLGFPASNRKVKFSGMTWFRFKDGKLVEGCDRWNAGALMACLQTGTPAPTVFLLSN